MIQDQVFFLNCLKNKCQTIFFKSNQSGNNIWFYFCWITFSFVILLLQAINGYCMSTEVPKSEKSQINQQDHFLNISFIKMSCRIE